MIVRFVLMLFLLAGFSGQVFLEAAPLKSSMKDRARLELTVYQNGMALVKDTRRIDGSAGSGEMHLTGIAAAIIPESLLVKPLSDTTAFYVHEHTYRYDLASRETLLDRYVGEQVTLVHWNDYHDRKETVDAVLAAHPGMPVYRIDGKIYLDHPGTVVLPPVPDLIAEEPTLILSYVNSGKAQEVEFGYLTSGISWHADYSLVQRPGGALADLSGWVSLDNRSGVDYPGASLKIVGGQVNRVTAGQESVMDAKMSRTMLMAASAPASFERQAFSEYQLYDLNRTADIPDGISKQVRFIQSEGITVSKEYRVMGEPYYYGQVLPEKPTRSPVEVRLRIQNTSEAGLGEPLPAGTVRLYEHDAQGNVQFTGEDTMAHIPAGEEIILRAGEAFDLTAERTQTEFKQITHSLRESEWEIILRNHKSQDVEVDVLEPVGNNWKLINHSHPYEKENAFTLRFRVPVPAGGQSVLRYRVTAGL